ncbi:MAG: hypothetical protein C0407_15455 [Desulfobacca sp.]|nr:hypothetical protein [Desulfobacca sp.]
MSILNVILPIFLVISPGYFLKRTQFFNETLVQALNQLVYPILLSVLIFREISRSPFRECSNGWLVAAVFIPMSTFFFFLSTGRLMDITSAQIGSLAQGLFRGNIAYVGLAMVTIPLWVWFVGI